MQEAGRQAARASGSEELSRRVRTGEITVGGVGEEKGQQFYTSYGDGPHGNSTGRTVKVARIVDGSRPDCVHITDESGNHLGWIPKDKLQVVTQ